MNYLTRIERLLANRVSGSTEIFLDFIKIALDYNLDKHQIKEALQRLQNEFSDMAILHFYESQINAAIDLSTTLEFILKRITTSSQVMSKHLAHFIQSTDHILTYSNSKLISDILLLLGNNLGSVTIMASEPENEGQNLFLSICDNIGRAELVSDQDGILKIMNNEIDYLLISCDSFNEYFFINKRGTRLIIEKIFAYDANVILLIPHFKEGISSQNPTELFEKVELDRRIILIRD
ncbi:MAG: hypothetical protein INQ03_19545 [Candidatus Heimdallarchaeota archaeon]|nr:hypothetical protein [Candidatus Heimdallarchaeota archaeon]